jgi:Ribbon-helix-helix protein, copG family
MPKRTTVTLDDDVAAKLDQEVRRTGVPFRQAVNDALRRGLEPQQKPRKKFKVRPLKTGPLLIDIECTSRALDELDRLEREQFDRR